MLTYGEQDLVPQMLAKFGDADSSQVHASASGAANACAANASAALVSILSQVCQVNQQSQVQYE